MGIMNGGLVMAKYFKTYTANMNHAQKKSLYDEYKESPMYINKPLTFNEFFAQKNILEMVSMKCLYCHFEINVSYYMYQFPIDDNIIAFPFDECPKCCNHQLVPLDVYNKLNS